jgi:hypothetical protein
MPNLVQQNGSTAVAVAGANPWAEAARGVESGSYLKFNGNDGRWSFGQDDEDLPVGSRAIADMETLAFGWTCWVESNVEEEIFVTVASGQKPPAEHELTDHGPYDDDDGWRESASLSLILESYGDDDQDEAVGTQLLWKSSTGGQVRQIRKMTGAYGRVFSQHPGEFPVIELGAESYAPKNKKHGKLKWSPVLKIVGWMTAAEVEGLAGGFGDDDREEPVAKTKPKNLPAPEPEEEDEPAPAPRRRAAAPVEEEEEAPAPTRGRRAAAAPVEDEEEDAPAPAPRSRRAAVPVEEEEEEAPAPRTRRGQAAAPAEEEDEDAAPAPRTGRGRRAAAAAPAEEEEEAPAPRTRRGQAAAAAPAEEDEPAPRARRGAAPANARLRRFD